MNKLYFQRIHSGLTQAELAKLADTTQSQISMFENGETMPSTLSLIKLSKALNVTIDDIIDKEDV